MPQSLACERAQLYAMMPRALGRLVLRGSSLVVRAPVFIGRGVWAHRAGVYR